MVRDAERFILSNRAIIEQAPLQTYASALVFSPTESLTRKCYSDQLPAWLVRRPTIKGSWGNSVQSLEGHERVVTAIAFSPDGKFLATGSQDTEVRLWDPATGALHSTLQGHHGDVDGIAFSPEGHLASVSALDRTVRIWEPVTGVISRILDTKSLDPQDRFHVFGRASLAFLPNGDLVVEYRSRSVAVWNRRNDSLSDFLLQGFTSHHILAVSSQGRLALKAHEKPSNRTKVLLYDSTTGEMQILNVGSPAEVCEAAFSSDEQLALGFSNGTIEVRDPAKGSFKKLNIHSNKVGALSFSPDGRFLVSGSSGNTLRLWELSTQKQSLIGTLRGGVGSVAFSPDGKRIAAIHQFSLEVQILDPYFRVEKDLRDNRSTIVWRISISPGGDQIAVVFSSDHRIRIHDTATEALQFTFVRHLDQVQTIVFSHDGKQLASASRDQSIRLWDPRRGTESMALNTGSKIVQALDFSPDGTQLASGGREHDICIWNSRTGHLHHKFEGRFMPNIRFSPSGNKLASINSDKTIIIWDTMTGELLHRFKGAGYTRALAFSPNGVYFASKSVDRGIMLYNLQTEELQDRFTGNETDYDGGIAFSGDSMSLAFTVGGNVILVDVKNGRTTGTIPCYRYLEQLSFSTDGTYLRTERGHIRINKVLEDSSDDLSTHDNHWRCGWEWLMQGDRKMLWLPPDFREPTLAHHDGLFVVAHQSGGIVFFKVNQGEAVADV